MGEPPETPDEELPQDPGTSGLADDDDARRDDPIRPEAPDEQTGTDASRRLPRHREGAG
jgi:hypothetical protein